MVSNKEQENRQLKLIEIGTSQQSLRTVSESGRPRPAMRSNSNLQITVSDRVGDRWKIVRAENFRASL